MRACAPPPKTIKENKIFTFYDIYYRQETLALVRFEKHWTMLLFSTDTLGLFTTTQVQTVIVHRDRVPPRSRPVVKNLGHMCYSGLLYHSVLKGSSSLV